MRDKLLILALVLIVVLLASFTIAEAQGATQTLYPSYRLVNTEGELIFEGWNVQRDGLDCLQMSNGNLFCCCDAGCSIEEYIPVPTSTRGVNDPTPTPMTPTDTPVTPPTDTPEPPPVKANCGLGNLDEGADPNDNACGKKTGEENEPDGPPGLQ